MINSFLNLQHDIMFLMGADFAQAIIRDFVYNKYKFNKQVNNGLPKNFSMNIYTCLNTLKIYSNI